MMCHCEITSLVINCVWITTIRSNNEHVSLGTWFGQIFAYTYLEMLKLQKCLFFSRLNCTCLTSHETCNCITWMCYEIVTSGRFIFKKDVTERRFNYSYGIHMNVGAEI